jgi:hypothetical protein
MNRYRITFSRPWYNGSTREVAFDFTCGSLTEAIQHAAECAKPESTTMVRVSFIAKA